MPVVSSPYYGKAPHVSPWLVLLTPILLLLLYMSVVDNPLVGQGQDLTQLNPQVTGELSWREVWLNSTPPLSRSSAVYRPVLASLLRLEWRAWGDSPSSFHSFSLILLMGLLASALAFFRQLAPDGLTCSLAVLLMFVHPMLSESVLSVAGQGILLSLGLSMAVLWLVSMKRRKRLSAGTTVPLVFVCSAIAYGCHEIALILPIWVILLLLLEPRNRVEKIEPRRRRRKKSEQPEPAGESPSRSSAASVLLIAACVLPLLGYLALRHAALGQLLPDREVQVAAVEGLPAPLWASAPAIMARYALRLIWPFQPTLFYVPAQVVEGWLDVFTGWIFLLLLIAGVAAAWRRAPLLALALGLMLAPLVALSHWIPLSNFMAEMPVAFALPCFALAVSLLLGIFAQLPARLSFNVERRRRAVYIGAAILFGLMAWQAWQRGRQWETPQALYLAESAMHPDDPRPQIEQIRLAVLRGDIESAEALVEEVQPKATPKDLNHIARLKALLYEQAGETLRLRQLLRDELRAERPPEPGHFLRLATSARGESARDKLRPLLEAELAAYPESFEGLSELLRLELEEQEAKPEASRDYRTAINLADRMMRAAPREDRLRRAGAMALYGSALAKAGYLEEALQQLAEALNLDPGLYEPYVTRARIYWGRGEYQLAEDAIARALLHARVTSYVDLAQLYVGIMEEQGRQEQAMAWLSATIRKYPSDMALHGYAARYLIANRRYDQAQLALDSMARSQGAARADYYAALAALVWNRDRDLSAAIDLNQQALRINPSHPDAQANLRMLRSVRDRSSRETSPTSSPAPAPTPVATPNVGTGSEATTATTAARHADAMTPTPLAGPAGPPR